MHYEGTFHSYLLDELDSFAQVVEITRCLAAVPAGLDDDAFRRKLSDPGYLLARNEVYDRPRVEEMLRREANDALEKRMPEMQDVLNRTPSAAAGAVGLPGRATQWVTAQGHFSHTSLCRSADLQRAVNDLFHQPCTPVGDFLYPPGGYRAWHTNRYDDAGWALFLVQVDVARESCFRFVHPDTNELVSCWDRPSSAHIFRIRPDRLFWHCVFSEGANRWSQGFLVPDAWQTRLPTGCLSRV